MPKTEVYLTEEEIARAVFLAREVNETLQEFQQKAIRERIEKLEKELKEKGGD